jgi:hypothetical protein
MRGAQIAQIQRKDTFYYSMRSRSSVGEEEMHTDMGHTPLRKLPNKNAMPVTGGRLWGHVAWRAVYIAIGYIVSP